MKWSVAIGEGVRMELVDAGKRAEKRRRNSGERQGDQRKRNW